MRELTIYYNNPGDDAEDALVERLIEVTQEMPNIQFVGVFSVRTTKETT